MGNNILKGKKGIIFGALDSSSIAWKTAERVYNEGGEFILTNAYPNPFNNSLKFNINVLKPALIDIYITDIMGRRIRNIFNGEIMPGTQLVSWDGRSKGFKKVASGIYYIVAKGNYTEQRIPVTLMK